jgi:hypothetical protein
VSLTPIDGAIGPRFITDEEIAAEAFSWKCWVVFDALIGITIVAGGWLAIMAWMFPNALGAVADFLWRML